MAIIKCPECGHPISDRAPVCPSCGVEIANKITKCHECGEVYFDNQDRCPVCHAPNPHHDQKTENVTTSREKPMVQPKQEMVEGHVSRRQATQVPSEEEKTPKKSKTVLVVSLVIALFICGAMLYFYTNATAGKEQEAYELALKSNDINVLQDYLDTYKDAPEEHRDSIYSHLRQLKQVDLDWTNALVSNTKMALEEYLEKYPDSPRMAEAKHKMDSLDWVSATDTNTKDSYQAYLDQNPNGEHVDEATQKVKEFNAKTVQSEEKSAITSIIRAFFRSIQQKDEETLVRDFNPVLSNFLGKEDAVKSDVVTFMHKLYKPEVEAIEWQMGNDLKIEKKEVGDEEYEYTVSFSASQMVENKKDEIQTSNYLVRMKMNPDFKITTFNLTRVLKDTE